MTSQRPQTRSIGQIACLLTAGGAMLIPGAIACGSTEATCEDLLSCGKACDSPEYAVSHPEQCGSLDASAGHDGQLAADARSEQQTDASSPTTDGNTADGSHPADGSLAKDGFSPEAAADVIQPPPCDVTKAPYEDACTIDNVLAAFVSPTGTDKDTCGTKEAPCKTIARGLTVASAGKSRVYVCGDGGEYDESVLISAKTDGLEIFGGFACANWTYAKGTIRAKVHPLVAGTAWTIEGVTHGLTLEDMWIESSSPTTEGASSIAVVVRQSNKVVLRGCVLKSTNARAGADGADGAKGADGATPGVAQNGNDATCGARDAGAPDLLPGGTWSAPSACGSKGGYGGTAHKDTNGASGGYGIPQVDVNPAAVDNAGAGRPIPQSGGPGDNGSMGNPGTPGLAARSAGTFSLPGFTPASAGDGSNGFTAQGGGGGGASGAKNGCIGASGGAGGMGGCGGIKATGGKGGGASLSLFAWDSELLVDACTLERGNGGDGGHGGRGGEGGIGGNGGEGGRGISGMGEGGRGGRGGPGGPGGSGAGGTGGPSIGIGYQGTRPLEGNPSTFVPGVGGNAGQGGRVPGFDAAPSGNPGVSSDWLDLSSPTSK